MIPVYIEQLFNVFTLEAFLLFAYLWFREELRRNKISNGWSEDKNQLYFCNGCHHSFLAKPGQTVVRCPKCKELCFLRRKKRF